MKGPSVPKVKRTICLPADVSHRLDIHAVGLKLDVSTVVTALIQEHCRRYVLQDRGIRDPGGDTGLDGAGEGRQADAASGSEVR